MSISQNIKTNRYLRKVKKLSEYIYRWGRISNPYKIYFPYKTDFIHPAFDELKNNPLLKYSNKKDAKILHLVMGGNKSDLEKNHIVEIIDHAFSIIASCEVFPREPVEYFNRQEKIKELYLNERLKKIVFVSNGQRELTKHYFPQKEIYDKSVVIPIPWKDNIEIGKKQKTKSTNFLFIASHFENKGVQIVLEAWEKFKSIYITDATLTLVSHDIAKKLEDKLRKDIKLIKQAPLPYDFKDNLYKNSDVVLALTLTDGITAIEATSYGKPIIAYEAQHTKDFIDNDNGIEIKVPINMYDVDKYGIVWKTKKEFNIILKKHISDGTFSDTIDELIKTFERYNNDKEFLEKQTKNAIDKYYKDYTIKNRNKKLLEIYDGYL